LLRCSVAALKLQAACNVFVCLLTAVTQAQKRALNALMLPLPIAGIDHHGTGKKGDSLINQTEKSGSTTA